MFRINIMVSLWWEEVDSNHRRRSRRIYSPFHLATLESSRKWSWWSESNQQPADYKSAALSLRHISRCAGLSRLSFYEVDRFARMPTRWSRLSDLNRRPFG